MKATIKAKLVAKGDGLYVNYVFQNLEVCESSEDRYQMVTRCPNWQNFEELNIGDEGYLTYEKVKAGDTYNDKLGSEQKYLNTAIYFINFIKETKGETKEYNF